jgi:intracellular septation protein A
MSLIQVNWNPNEKQLRTFGLVCAVVCVVLGALTLWRGSIAGIELQPASARQLSYALWAVAVVSSGLAWTMPKALLRPYQAATAISLPIGFVVSYVVLGVLFYLVLTPIGLVFRLMGRDLLTRSFDRSASSYWVRRAPVTDINSYYRQF